MHSLPIEFSHASLTPDDNGRVVWRHLLCQLLMLWAI